MNVSRHNDGPKRAFPFSYMCVAKHSSKLYYHRVFSVPCVPFDRLIVERLKVLAGTDTNVANKIQQGMEDIRTRQTESLVSIEDQLRVYTQKPKLQKNLVKLGALLDDDDKSLTELPQS